MDFNDPALIEFIKRCLDEDLGDGDHSSLAVIPPDAQGKSRILFKEDGVLAGIALAETVLHTVDPGIKMHALYADGDWISKGTVVAEAEGRVQALLAAERLLLNFMQRLSAIATQTREVANLIKDYHTTVLDTRKTTPGLRLLEKWAVKIGGGHNHRIGLYDMIMLKDNHVDTSGGIASAVTKANEYLKKIGKPLGIEVETRNLDEVKQVLEAGGVQRIMLDNFTPVQCAEAVALINHRVETEASGGINKNNIVAYAASGVDFISLGYLTHSVKALDISMKTSLVQ